MSDERTLLAAMSQPSPSTRREPVRIVPRPTATLPQLPPYSPVAAPSVVGEALLPGPRSASLFTGPSLIASTTFAGVSPRLMSRMPTAPITVAARAVPLKPVSQATVAATVPGSAVQMLASSALQPTSIIVVDAEAESELWRSAPSRPLLSDASPVGGSLHALTTHHGTGDDVGRPFCQPKRRDFFCCARCEVTFSDVLRFREHLSRVHGVAAAASVCEVHAPVNVEPTDLMNSMSTSTALPQSPAVHRQLVPVNAADNDVQDSLNNNAERYDNDNDNGGELVIDLSSAGNVKACRRQTSNVESGNLGDEARH